MRTAAVTAAAQFADVAGRSPALWDYVTASELRPLVVCTSKNPNAKFVVLLVSPETGRPALAVKVPTTDAAERAVDAEARMLLELHRRYPAVGDAVPQVVATVEYERRRALVTTAAQGTSMATTYLRRRHTARPDSVAADFETAARWLGDFQRQTASGAAAVEMDAGVAARLAERFARDAYLGRDLDCLHAIHSRLACATVPRTAVHGDFWVGNVLVRDGTAAGVVDWEDGRLSGEPLRDVARFAHMYALFLDRTTRTGRAVAGHPGLRAGVWGAGVTHALDGEGWFPELFRRFVRDALTRLGAPPSRWRDVAVAAIAEVAAFADDDGYAARHLELFRRVSRGAQERGT